MFLLWQAAGTNTNSPVGQSGKEKHHSKMRLRTFSLDNQADEQHLCLGFS
jgi:hypothetical protein